jgi:hypothetical protein
MKRSVLGEDEYRRILDNLPGYLKPVIQTASFIGWRINSEILALHKNAVDLESGCLRLALLEAGDHCAREFGPLRDCARYSPSRLKN